MNLRIGVVLVALAVVAALVGPWLVSADPRSQELALRLAGPTWAHPLGLDELGRDMISRLMLGSRLSLFIGVTPVLIAFVIGSIILLDTEAPGFGISRTLIGSVAFVGGSLVLLIIWLSVRSHARPVVSGRESMVGALAVAQADFVERGTVRVGGELWTAYARSPVHAGDTVRIVAIDTSSTKSMPNQTFNTVPARAYQKFIEIQSRTVPGECGRRPGTQRVPAEGDESFEFAWQDRQGMIPLIR